MRWILVLGLALLLFGCTIPLSTEQWLSCEKLSNASSISVPDCDSQAECVQKANGTLFFFEKHSFSLSVQQKLSSYANHVGASWFYTNKAKEEALEVAKLCSARSAESLPEHINSLRYWLGGSLQEIDSANADLVELLALEESALEKDGVSFIPEEGLMQSRIEFASVLNDLSGDVQPSTELGKNVFESTKRLDAFASQLGLKGARVSEISSLDLLQKYGTQGVSDAIARTILVPQWSPLVQQSLAVLTDYRKLRDALSSLAGTDSFQIFLAIEQSVGAEGSSASEVSRMFSEDAQNRKLVLEKIVEEKKIVAKNLDSIGGKISSLANSVGALDSSSIALLSAQNIQGISTGRSGDSNIVQDWQNRLAQLKWKALELSNKEASGSLSVGENLQEWKWLGSESAALEEELEQWESESLSALEDACYARLKGAEGEYWEVHNESLSPAESEALAIVKGKIEDARSSRTLPKCLFALNAFEQWKRIEAEQAFGDVNASGPLYECASWVKEAFDSDWPLYPLRPQYLAFQEFSRTHAGAELSFACEKLKSNVLQYVQSTSEFHALALYDSELRKKFNAFSFFDSAGMALPDGIASIRNSWNALRLHKGTEWDWHSLWVEGPPVAEKLRELDAKLQSLFEESVDQWMARNAQWSLAQGILEADASQSSLLRVLVQNPTGLDLNGIFRLETFPDARLESGDGKLVSEKGTQFIFFSSLPVGESSWKIRSSALRIEILQTKIRYVDLESVWVEKTLQLVAPSSLRGSISVLVSLPEESREASASVPFSRIGNALQLQWPFSKEKVSVQWKENSPLRASWKNISISTDDNSFSFSAILSLSNSSAYDFSNSIIALSFPESGALSYLQLMDEMGDSISAKALPNSIFSFSLSPFPPYSERTLLVRASGENAERFFRSLWEECKRELELLSERTDSIGADARTLLQENNWIEGEYSPAQENETIVLWNSVQLLESRAAQQDSLQQEFDSRSASVAQKLEDLRSALGWFRSHSISVPEFEHLYSLAQVQYSKALQLKDSNLEQALASLSLCEQQLSAWKGMQEWIEANRETLDAKSVSLLSADTRSALDWKLKNVLSFQDWNSAWGVLQDWNSALGAESRSAGQELAQAFQNVQLFSTITQNNSALNSSKQLLASVSAKQLDEVDYLPPTSKEKLKEGEARLKALYKQGWTKEIQSFFDAYRSADFGLAKEKWSFAEIDFLPAFEEAQSINNWLEADLAQMKSDAQTAISNFQQHLHSLSAPDSRLLSLADKAEQALEREDFLNALRYARLGEKALQQNGSWTGMFSLGEIPLALAPLLALIALAAYFRFGRKKDAEKEIEKKKALETFINELE
ncbi:MAG: hypothetical protein V1847_00295 [Candidatus Diapherotrites archaeon]